MGLRTSGGTKGVGRSTTNAVVAASVAGSTTPVVEMLLADADAGAAVSGEMRLPTVSHYLSGESSTWIRNVAHYEQLRVREAYPGIDVLHRSLPNVFADAFELAAGANPRDLRMRLPGPTPLITSSGDLLAAGPAGLVRHSAPKAIPSTRRCSAPAW